MKKPNTVTEAVRDVLDSGGLYPVNDLYTLVKVRHPKVCRKGTNKWGGKYYQHDIRSSLARLQDQDVVVRVNIQGERNGLWTLR